MRVGGRPMEMEIGKWSLRKLSSSTFQEVSEKS